MRCTLRMAVLVSAISMQVGVCAAAAGGAEPPVVAEVQAEKPVEIVMRFEAGDGTPLEAKLTLPAGREGRVPVVMWLHGAGPRTYDNPFAYVDDEGQRAVGRYLEFHAAAALREAGRTNLSVHIYENADHDVDWTWRAAREGGPPAYRDAFDLIAKWVRSGR